MKRKLLLVVCAVLLTSLNASAGILDGWTKMETNVIASPQNYYFIILHTNNELMLGVTKECDIDGGRTSSSDKYDYISYQTAGEPCMDLKKVWTIESCTATGYTTAYILRSLENVDCPANINASYQWELKTDGDVHEVSAESAAFNLVATGTSWNIQDATATTYYWGAWNPATYSNNQRVAGNSGGNGNEKGSFNIYYMDRSIFNQKYQFFGGTDMNHTMINRGFEFGSATGWTGTWITNGEIRSTNVGSGNANVNPHSGLKYLYRTNTGDYYDLSYTVSNLPSGTYTGSLFLCNDKNFVFNNVSAESFGTSTPANTWKEIKVENQSIDEGEVTFSARGWWTGAVDDASLTYVPNTVSNDADAYTLGNTTTALKWYSITIPENGNYKLISTNAATISYTTTGTDKPADATKATLSAGGVLTLNSLTTAETLYVGTSVATKLAFVKSSGGDLTYLVTNPSFESNNFSGWTNPSPSMQTQDNSDFDKTGTYYAERWQASSSGGLSNGTLTQSVSTLPAGTYKLTAKAKNVEQYNDNAKGTGFYLTAGSEQVMVGTNVLNTAYATLADAGSLTIGAKAQSCSGNWIAVDDFQLTYVAALPTGSEIEDLMVSGDMNATVSTAQTNAVDTYKSSQTAANCNEALSAIANAQVSKAYYELMNTLITDAPTTYNITTKLDAAGQTEWSTQYATIQGNYDSGLYETVDEVKTALRNAHIAAIKAQGVGSDWTDLLRNPDFEESTSGWTCTNVTSGPTRENAISASHGSWYAGFWNANLTGTIDIYQSVTLPAGTYRMSFDASNNGDNSNKWDNVKLYFGDTESSEQAYNTTYGVWRTFDFEFTVSTEATANLGVTFTPTGTGQIWERVDNFRLTYLGVEKNVTVSAKVGKYGTVIFPFTPDVSTGFDNITFYSCSSVNSTTNNVQLTEVDKNDVTANTPYLIKNNGVSDFSKSISGYSGAVNDSYTVGLLTGVMTASTILASANNYVLQTQDDVQAFYSVDDAFTATPYKCYLTYSAGASVKAFGFEFGDIETGIGDVNSEKMNSEYSIFNLAGQKMSKLQRGVNIVNGKKVLVK